MARQAGHLFITGTLGDVTYYKMDGIYYARMKSSLSRKKVLTSPRFERTRQHANQLAEASRIASSVYKQIPKEQRNIKLFRAIVGEAKMLLATGSDKEVVLEVLLAELLPQSKTFVPKQRIKRKKELRLVVNKEGRLVLESLSIPELHVVGAASTQGYFEHQQRRERLVLESLSIPELHVVGAASTQGYFEHQQRGENLLENSYDGES